MPKRLFARVYVGDFGTFEIPERVEKRYAEAYYRKRAPKKSALEAMAEMERDLGAIQRFCWLMGMDGVELPGQRRK